MPLFCIVVVVVVVVFFFALIYILSKIAAFLSGVPVDGLWIDMNEPSNFCNGACNRSYIEPVGSDFNPHTPPYAIGNRKQPGGSGGGLPLNDKTLDMDAVHHNGATAYDMHNLYGEDIILPVMIYRRRWLLSVGAYSFCQQENERLTVNMRLTANMRLIGIPLITMGGVIIVNASGLEYCR